MLKTFINKFNVYTLVIFVFISIIGTLFLYLNNGLHNYYSTYKIGIPYYTMIRSSNSLKTADVPLMNQYEFEDLISSSDEVLKSCPDFGRNVRVSVWEARNLIDFRLEVRNPDQKIIENCANTVFNTIEEKRASELLKLEELNTFELKVFESSVKKVIESDDFKKFREFVNENVDILDKEKSYFNSDKNTIDQLNSVTNIDEVFLNQLVNPPPFRNNFLTGYIYNFLEMNKTLQYNKNMKTSKMKLISAGNFKNKNILKFNFAILFILIIVILLANQKKLRNLI